LSYKNIWPNSFIDHFTEEKPVEAKFLDYDYSLLKKSSAQAVFFKIILFGMAS
jgi:hypothetical protein